MKYWKKPEKKLGWMLKYRLDDIGKNDLKAIAKWSDEYHGVEKSNPYRAKQKHHFYFLAKNPLFYLVAAHDSNRVIPPIRS